MTRKVEGREASQTQTNSDNGQKHDTKVLKSRTTRKREEERTQHSLPPFIIFFLDLTVVFLVLYCFLLLFPVVSTHYICNFLLPFFFFIAACPRMVLDFNTQQHRRIPIFSLFPHPCRSSAAQMMARLQTTSGGSRLLSPGSCPTWKLPNWVFQFPLNVPSLGSILFWVCLSKCSHGIRDLHVFV